MIRRIFAGSLALLLALSSAPELSAQVITRANAPVTPLTGALGTTLAAPALSPLTGPSALSLNAALAPSLAVPALAPSLVAAVQPAAAKPVTVQAAAPVAAKAVAAAALSASPLPAPAAEQGHTPSEIAALRSAWQAAHALVETVPARPTPWPTRRSSTLPAASTRRLPRTGAIGSIHFMLLDRFARAARSARTAT